jgi:hypothetical protein
MLETEDLQYQQLIFWHFRNIKQTLNSFSLYLRDKKEALSKSLILMQTKY